MYVKRQLDLSKIRRKKSHFLFGLHQTGKTSLIQRTLRIDCNKGRRIFGELYIGHS